ncbi:MAG: type II toxin-antitoxin system HipA family toxin, partial [Propionibacterium sp.]|nr:type II toxin-antitoxin system HipA family toxin [Propionibacterium sp.]
MTTVDVFLDDAGATRLAGVAHFTRNRGRVSTTFLYAPEYLVGDGMSI